MPDFRDFLNKVSGMESSFGTDPKMTGNPYGMTPAAGNITPEALAKQNYQILTMNLGGQPNDFMQYLAWQQGATGATKLLKADPNAPAASVVGEAAIAGNIGKSSGLNPATATVSDFLGYISGKWQKVGGDTIYSKPTGETSRAGVTDWIANYFTRAALIVLGFIFIAAGLKGFIEGDKQEPQTIILKEPPQKDVLPSEAAMIREERHEARRKFLGGPAEKPTVEKKTKVKTVDVPNDIKFTGKEKKPTPKYKPPEHKGAEIEMTPEGDIKRAKTSKGKRVYKPRAKK